MGIARDQAYQKIIGPNVACRVVDPADRFMTRCRKGGVEKSELRYAA